MTTADQHLMTGAWALNATDDGERTAFEEHLRECETCLTEAVEMRETAARLSMLVELTPPPHLRDRVLAAAATTRQDRPDSPRPVTELRPRRPWIRRAAVLVAAASVLGVVVAGVQHNMRLSGEVEALQQVAARYEQLNSLISAPDAKTVSRKASNGGSGIAVFSAAQNKVLFLAADLPPLPPDRSYQLWVVDGVGPHPADVLTDGQPVVMDFVEGAEKLAVTVEPLGGSDLPTTGPVVSLPYA
ncbi:anti-sigma factor [Lentzea sp. NPDC051838]|uniref:anti-sigma factor n=1 Tax=Lentzea sp. NPDC051838 TaxID=3154849 RepID=UPI003449513D